MRFKSEDNNTRAAALLVQTRGAEPVIIKLLAQLVGTNGVDTAAGDSNDALAPVFTTDGIRINGKYKTFRIYSAAGQLLKQGGYQENISTLGLTGGIAILQLVTEEGTKSFAFQLK